MPYVTVKDIKRSIIDIDNCSRISKEDFNKLVNTGCKPQRGDVLFSKDGTVGKVSLVNSERPFVVLSSIAIVRPFEDVFSSQYLFHVFHSTDFLHQALSNKKGVAIRRIILRDLHNLTLPLPPLPEQKRIVAKIEELFSDLDAGVDELEKAQAQLKRYRQSVLKAAFEGTLTQEWREKQKGKLEPASVLLERIREGRKKKAQAEGKKWKEPEPVDTSNLPELPKEWAWARLGGLSSCEPNAVTDGPFGSNLKTSHYTESGPRVVRLQNIGDGIFIDEKAHISENHYRRLGKHRVFEGDIVIASLGENPPRACIVPADVIPAIVKADCIRFKVFEKVVVARYINFVLNTSGTRKRVEPYLHGVGRPRLGLGGIRQIPIPLAPHPEQSRIVEEIESRFAIADKAEEAIEQSLKQAARLRQSILKRAFEGNLVPQDPKDEPAEKLLERIKAEKAKMTTTQRTRRSSSSKEP